MKNEILIKELPSYDVYYKKGIISDYSKIPEFILSSADECLNTNPDIKCLEDDYCFVSYLDRKPEEKDIKIMYAQAVTKMGKENDSIKFMKLKPVKAVCLYHHGSFTNIHSSYDKINQYIKENGFQVIEPPRERYIDGIWNKENEEDWLTEIQFPIQ